MSADLSSALFLAGLAHLAIAVASLAIPTVLDWRRRLEPLDDFTRNLFWVYAAFILFTNVGFGVVLVLEPSAVGSGSGLGRVVAGFIALYWLARLGVQFLVFDASEIATTRLARFGQHALTAAFVYIALVSGWATLIPSSEALP